MVYNKFNLIKYNYIGHTCMIHIEYRYFNTASTVYGIEVLFQVLRVKQFIECKIKMIGSRAVS